MVCVQRNVAESKDMKPAQKNRMMTLCAEMEFLYLFLNTVIILIEDSSVTTLIKTVSRLDCILITLVQTTVSPGRTCARGSIGVGQTSMNVGLI